MADQVKVLIVERNGTELGEQEELALIPENIPFSDPSVVGTDVKAAIIEKYPTANPAGYETPSQLNSRDTANRSRANHTGTQLADTVSDFSNAVLSVLLTGLSVITSTPVVATDSILIAIGKLQAQASANASAIALRALASVTVSAGTGLSGGGDLTANRTISMPNVGTPSTYGSDSQVPVLTTDAQGRVSAVTNTAISILSSAVTNFASTVIATVLTGLSLATSTDVVAADSILVAFGKVQAILNQIRTTVTPQPTGTANAAGTSTAMAKADHVHSIVLVTGEVTSAVNTTTNTNTPALMNLMTLTPVAGTYLVNFLSTVQSGTNGAEIDIQIYVGGVAHAPSLVNSVPKQSNSDAATNGSPLSTHGRVTVNGSQAIEIRWNTSTGTATARTRTLTITRIG